MVGATRVHHPFVLVLSLVSDGITGKVSNFAVKVGLVYVASCILIWYVGIPRYHTGIQATFPRSISIPVIIPMKILSLLIYLGLSCFIISFRGRPP